MRTRKCPRCEGTGTLRLVGAEMRRRRRAHGWTLRAVARALGLSPTYVCDLELGRRHWRPELYRKYARVVARTSAERRKIRKGAKRDV